MLMPYVKETILNKALKAVKLTDAELSIVIGHLLHENEHRLLEIEELKNELEKVSSNRQPRTKTTKRNVSTTGVSGESDS
jgi:regulator of replication initiation timing